MKRLSLDCLVLGILTAACFLRYQNQVEFCSTWLASDLGDNTAGIAYWGTWERLRAPQAPGTAFAQTVEDSLQAIQAVASAVTVQFSDLLAEALGLTCGFNMMSLLFSLSSTLAAYWLLRFVLRAGALVAGIGAAILGLGPYATFMGHTHVQWLGHFPLVLVLGFSIRMTTRPTRQVGVLAGLSVILTLFTEPHMPLASAGILIAVAAGAVLAKSSRAHSELRPSAIQVRRSLTAFVLTTGIGVAAVGLLLLRLRDSRGSLNLPVRGVDDLWGFSPVQYFADGIWSRLVPLGEFQTVADHVSDSQIVAQYFAGFFALTGVALSVWSIFSSRTRELTFTSKVAIGSSGALVLVGFMLAAPPYLNVGDFEIPLIPSLIHEIVPSYRFYWRYLYLVLLGLVAWGVIGWTRLAELSHSKLRIYVFLIAGTLALLDIIGYRAFLIRGFDFRYTPEVYSWLASQNLKSQESVAELVGRIPGHATWQTIHGKPLVNGGPPNSDLFWVVKELDGFVQPQVACIANTMKIRYLLRHTSDPPIPPFRYQNLLRSFRYEDQAERWSSDVRAEYAAERFWYDVDVYESQGTGLTGVYLTYGPGFGSGTFDGVRGIAPMSENRAFLVVRPVPGSATSVAGDEWPVNFDIRGDLDLVRISITRESGERVWSGLVGQDWQRISFQARDNEIIQLYAHGRLKLNQIWVGRFGSGDCA